jgi:hypothetical protein
LRKLRVTPSASASSPAVRYFPLPASASTDAPAPMRGSESSRAAASPAPRLAAVRCDDVRRPRRANVIGMRTVIVRPPSLLVRHSFTRPIAALRGSAVHGGKPISALALQPG